MSAQASSSNPQRPPRDLSDDDSLSEDDDYASEDNNFSDWDSPTHPSALPCPSLFGPPGTVFPSLDAALQEAREVHGVDFVGVCARLEMDFYARVRLGNWIRKNHPTPAEVLNLQGDEAFLSDDTYLLPVLEDDPLLQAPIDDWSDDEDPQPPPADSHLPSSTSPTPADMQQALLRSQRIIRSLRRQLAESRQELVDYKAVVNKALGVSDVRMWMDARVETGPAERGKKGEDPGYFEQFEDGEGEEGEV